MEDTIVVSDASGLYQAVNLPPGSYTVTPSMSGYDFSPVSTTVILGPNAVNVNFTATRKKYSVSGKIIDDSGNPMPGVTLTLHLSMLVGIAMGLLGLTYS
jgi:hypothetical protein